LNSTGSKRNRSLPTRADVVHHRVGDAAEQIAADLDALELAQCAGSL
jgi:hypothetical protein